MAQIKSGIKKNVDKNELVKDKKSQLKRKEIKRR